MLFDKILVNRNEFELLKQKVDDLDEKLCKQDINEFIKDLENELGVGLTIVYSIYRGYASIKLDRVYARDIAQINFVNHRDLLISLQRERQNIIHSVKSYLYDNKEYKEENKYAKL